MPIANQIGQFNVFSLALSDLCPAPDHTHSFRGNLKAIFLIRHRLALPFTPQDTQHINHLSVALARSDHKRLRLKKTYDLLRDGLLLLCQHHRSW